MQNIQKAEQLLLIWRVPALGTYGLLSNSMPIGNSCSKLVKQLSKYNPACSNIDVGHTQASAFFSNLITI